MLKCFIMSVMATKSYLLERWRLAFANITLNDIPTIWHYVQNVMEEEERRANRRRCLF